MLKIEHLLKKSSVVGIVGSRSSGKTSLALNHIIELRQRYKNLSIAVFGVEESLFPYLKENNIKILENKLDILDLKLESTVIYVAEFALFFDTSSRSKQLNKLMRFFDRIEHLNCKLIIDTAREGYYNKFFCARVTSFLVKRVEYESLVNGTWLKESIKSIPSSSDYRLVCDIPTYYVVTNSDDLTQRCTFGYNKNLDSKKDNINLFETVSKK